MPTTETVLKPVVGLPHVPVFSDSNEGWKSATVEMEPPDPQEEEESEFEQKPKRRLKAKVTPHGPVYEDSADLLYIAFAKTFGEIPYPAYQLEWRLALLEDPSKPKHTELQYVRSIVQRPLLREGESLSHALRWWRIISISVLTLVSLICVLMNLLWRPGYGSLMRLLTGDGVLTPIWLVVGSSLACLVQRLAWYGWHRLRRQLSVLHSPSRFKKRWRETVRTSGDIDITKREQS